MGHKTVAEVLKCGSLVVWKCGNIKLGILVPGPNGVQMTLNFSD